MKTKRQIMEQIRERIKWNEEQKIMFYEKSAKAHENHDYKERDICYCTMRVIDHHIEGLQEALEIINMNTAPWEE